MRRLALFLFLVVSSGCAVFRSGTEAPGPKTALPASPLPPAAIEEVALPLAEGSLKVAVLGDTGTGGKSQYQTAAELAEYHKKFPFTIALMLGDNMYGADAPRDYVAKFEKPYKPLLDAGVKFYASLGNHDNPNQRFYKLFNMGGEKYYSFKPKEGVRFFALDSNYLDPAQLAWLEKELAASGSDWKICFFHHPLYSSGDKHGPALEKRQALEPIFIKHGVSVVFSGHEHFYERIKPQQGIHYFTTGGAAKLRPGNNVSELTAKGFDDDYHFMIMEIVGDELYFQTISRPGKTVDSGKITRPGAQAKAEGKAEKAQEKADPIPVKKKPADRPD
jgi:hypothetical protein